MSKLTRVTAKVFGATADGTLADPEIGQFGSAKAGTYVGTGDVATIQNLPAWSNGWIDAVTPTQQFAPLPERTGVDKVLSYQNAYVLQQGIPEWDSATDYYTNGFCSKNGKIYFSKTDNNVNHDPETDTVNWEEFSSGGVRNIGEIVTSTIPLTDAGLHLLDGSLLSYGSYSDFIDYIADLYDSGDYTDIFETEANWQTTVTTYGVCGKFVYDSVNNTVRLPKYSNKIYTKDFNSTTAVKGNGMTLGITDGNGTAGVVCAGAGIIYGFTDVYGSSIGSAYANPTFAPAKTIGITTDETKSGLIADLANLKSPLDGYYYIVVATSTKTQIVVDIDEIATDLNGKADVDLTNASGTSGLRRLIKSGSSGNAWYKIYSEYNATNGNYIGLWAECGNTYYQGSTMASTNNTVAFPFVADNYQFTGTNYTFIPQVNHSTAVINGYTCYEEYTARTKTSTVLRMMSGAFFGYTYYACGYVQASS